MKRLDLDQFCTALARKKRAIVAEVMKAENDVAERAKRMFVVRSSGPYKLKTLAAMGHPYGRGKRSRVMLTVANLDPTIINVQSGRFKRMWRVGRCRRTGKRYLTSVLNGSPEAKWMLGTQNMIPRRIDMKVKQMITNQRFARARVALRAGLRA